MTSAGMAGLGLIILGLSGTIAFEVAGGSDQATHLSPGSALVTRVAAPGLATRSPNETDRQVNEILARPIFSSDRKPIGSAARGITGLSRLTGIVVTGTSKIAIFAGPSGGKPVVVEEGSRVNAFEVTSISGAGVTVVGPGGATMMTPVFDRSPPPVPQPARPQPPRNNTKKE
jgi:hypothetical protein